MKKKKSKLILRIIGALSILLGTFYLFLPHSTHIAMRLDLGLPHYNNIALGGVLLVLGAIFFLNGKRIREGIFFKGWKRNTGLTLVIAIITFLFLYLFFNSIFELIAGDVNNIKIIFAKVSSIGLALMVLVGMIKAKTIFGVKSARY